MENHLNVIKSREKKLFSSLGLDFTSSVIRFNHVIESTEPVLVDYYEISLEAPKKRKTFPLFEIKKPDDNTG